MREKLLLNVNAWWMIVLLPFQWTSSLTSKALSSSRGSLHRSKYSWLLVSLGLLLSSSQIHHTYKWRNSSLSSEHENTTNISAFSEDLSRLQIRLTWKVIHDPQIFSTSSGNWWRRGCEEWLGLDLFSFIFFCLVTQGNPSIDLKEYSAMAEMGLEKVK